MKKVFTILALISLSTHFFAQQSNCNNKDFEDQNFSNWSGYNGNNTGSSNLSMSSGFISNGLNAFTNDISARHTILTVNNQDSFAIDPNTLLPDAYMTWLAPNGSGVSVRIGNSNVGAEAEGLRYTFTVLGYDTVFTYQYACVFQDPSHQLLEQPGLMVNLYDQSMTLISALSDTIYSGDPFYNFITSSNPMIKYKRWSGVSINLAAYVGQQITVEFNNFDCAFSGHFGYTYLDLPCFGSYVANVWPGDCDYDLYANNMDLISLGIAFGSNGPTRSGASNNWVAQPMSDWPQSFQLGANYKHSDCNGDGTVDASDTLAISLNYNNAHPFKYAAPVYEAALPTLKMLVTEDTVGLNAFVNGQIELGNSGVDVDSLYAIGFTINYTNAYIDPANIGMSYNNSWLGTVGVDMITMTHTEFPGGLMDIGMSATNQLNNIDGQGNLAAFRFRTPAVASVGGNIALSFSDVYAVTVTGRVVSLNIQNDNVYFDPNFTGIQEYSFNDLFSVYPNPSSGEINFESFDSVVRSIELIDAIGRVVMHLQEPGMKTRISAHDLSAGLYQVRVICDKGMFSSKLLLSRH